MKEKNNMKKDKNIREHFFKLDNDTNVMQKRKKGILFMLLAIFLQTMPMYKYIYLLDVRVYFITPIIFIVGIYYYLKY